MSGEISSILRNDAELGKQTLADSKTCLIDEQLSPMVCPASITAFNKRAIDTSPVRRYSSGQKETFSFSKEIKS